MSRTNSILIMLMLFLVAPFAHAEPNKAIGDWHGSLATPIGELLLVIRISEDENGELIATLESPDQAPGQQIPISQLSVVDEHLSIKVQMIGASIEADWQEETGSWDGTFSQGMDIPLRLTRGLPADKPTIEGLDGDWKTTINRNGVDLRIILHITTSEHGTIAKLDSPDTMAMNVSVSDLTKDGDQISYAIKVIGGTFTGTLTDPDTIVGTWVVPGQDDVLLTYQRAAPTDEPIVRNRPQVPREPFGYLVEEVTYENPQAEGVTLAGTLTLPEGEGPFPAAILISGSGPQDRDETVFGHQPFLVLADYLTKHGIAVLRYDDRGVAQSTGDYSSATSADFATDANAAFAYLLSRDDIDHDAIGFIGHSEGGLIAPIALQTNTSNKNTIAYMVMLAGPGTSSKQIAKSQNRLISLSQGKTEEEIARAEAINSKIVDAIINSSSPEEAESMIREILTPQALEDLGVSESQIGMIIAQNNTPWIRYFLTYDPANFLPQITIPILALNGELDMQVPAPENLDGLRTLLKDNQDATIIERPGLNHLFQHATTGALGEYNDIEETFAPEAMQIIADWINERFGNE